ncbi:PO113 protein, partial [Glaucidium brasilianum]|nr:PO113 protein [Glaucidium brasilianum]
TLPLVMRPLTGTTYFTDASSQSQTAVVVWQADGGWQKRLWTQSDKSVQWLEAKAVQMALQQEPDSPINVVTDSLYVYKLVQKMTTVGFVQTEASTLLYDALEQRMGQVFLTHVNSHQSLPGPIIEGNNMADRAARGVWSLDAAKHLHSFLHLGAKALSKTCHISLSQAKNIIALCPYCQK